MLSPPSYPCEPTPPISVESIELALAPAPQPPAFSALLSDGIPPPNAVTLLKTEGLPLASDAPPPPTGYIMNPMKIDESDPDWIKDPDTK